MLKAGAANLTRHIEKVNALNVFPVPDGDTGTNMNLTMSSGVNELSKQSFSHVGKTAQAFSKGLLMGARGNSGVILSQLFRGFSKALADADELNAVSLATALSQGVSAAYSAVIKPVEGTILTVAKDAALGAQKSAEINDDLLEVMKATIDSAEKSLAKTPDLLPILKEVGVVDSGGQGLVYIYIGFLQALQGNAVVEELVPTISNELHLDPAQLHLKTDDITFGYCTEFLIHLEQESNFDLAVVRGQLQKWGDSIVAVADDELVKIHIHTEKPGDILNFGQKFGELKGIKIENMRQQHAQILSSAPTIASQKKQPFGIVAVSAGEGISRILKGLGVQEVVSGGQSMNPSTEDLLKAAQRISAENIIFLPNNKNIVMAAEQAASMLDTPAFVIPSRTIPQGIAAMLAYHADTAIVQNLQHMTEALSHVKSGQVTKAVRDSKWDELDIHEGDFLGMLEGDIVVNGQGLPQTALRLLASLIGEDDEVLTILFGQDVEKEQADELANQVEEAYPQLEIDVHFGGQPIYPYIFSVE
nr:DAK2 domain-containing protein [Ammoniphilus resinae]